MSFKHYILPIALAWYVIGLLLGATRTEALLGCILYLLLLKFGGWLE